MSTLTLKGSLKGSSSLTKPASVALGIFIGRFQFFHFGHLDAIIQGLRSCNFLAVLLGSANQPRTYFNPFSWEERAEMIMGSLPEELRSRVICLPLEDSTYNNNAWILNVQEQAEEARLSFGLPEDATIGLVGHKKDGTSYYLNMFPLWEEVAVVNTTNYSSTPLREQYFLTSDPLDQGVLPAPVIDWLVDFENAQPEAYETIKAEYLHVQKYKAG
ncbi:MAG: hypothetical protein EOP83_22110, partial [Verrucomicrobiaceae bacterium]